MTDRSPFESILRGARRRCPRCGTGRLFEGFLKVRHDCASCGEALHHHRADDAPPYVVMLIVGHVVVGAMLYLEIAYAPAMWVHAAIFLPLTVAMSLLLLEPTKGALVGLQWANRMHGFDPNAGPNT
ncbi:DUF983 domain-containing protein [Acuticoccus sp.]|uniref:DUF983 domain-containing protein n=1 Tax=Acuticoccus sp. TaxID=1904378 RepID=UPI003B51E64F